MNCGAGFSLRAGFKRRRWLIEIRCRLKPAPPTEKKL